ncbi:MAG: hypothetical protein ILP07_04215, partial [Treponema sp.]|nr:hypothetical protein [Treponema sp.]
MKTNSSDSKVHFFSASDKDSFAAYTVRTRFPEKFKQCGLTDYENFIGTTSVREGLGDKPKTPENHPGWQAIFDATKNWHGKTIKEFFENAPFLLVEFYFY